MSTKNCQKKVNLLFVTIHVNFFNCAGPSNIDMNQLLGKKNDKKNKTNFHCRDKSSRIKKKTTRLFTFIALWYFFVLESLNARISPCQILMAQKSLVNL